jgi:hypothetical protein
MAQVAISIGPVLLPFARVRAWLRQITMPITLDLCGFGASDRLAPADAQAPSGKLSHRDSKFDGNLETSVPVTSLIAALILAA